jgi:signal transduction histidine kinase
VSRQASLRWWWVGLAVSVATLAGLWLGEYFVDLPRVDDYTQLTIGTFIPAAWMVAGLTAWRVRPDSKLGALILLIGCLYPWNPLSYLVGSLGQWLFLMFGSVGSVILLHVVLSFPNGPMGRPARVAVGVAWVGLLFGAASLAVKPSSERCPVCPPNPLPTGKYPELSATLWELGTWCALIAAVMTAVILVYRWRGASAPLRRVLAPMLWGMFALTLLDVYGFFTGGTADGRPGTPGSYVFGLFSIGLLVGLLRTRRHRSVVADLVVDLDAMPEPGALRGLLARTLGDPSLQLVFWLPDRQRYVDEDGAPVELPDGEQQRVSVLRHAGEPLAALIYDPALSEDPKLLEAVSAAARLALENSRLQADLRARLNDVRESRARLVTATDAERRRIERKLHDGAQQTLLGLRLAVRLARTHQGSDPETLDALLAEIDGELQSAVEELRTLARGVHPAVLSDEGLEPALAALARRTAIPTQVRCECPTRLPAPVETAAYYVASESLANVLKHADASRADIDVSLSNGHAVIEVSDDGRGGADPLGSGLRGLRDRVEALDGALHVDSQAGAGTRVRAVIPCAVIAAPAP